MLRKLFNASLMSKLMMAIFLYLGLFAYSLADNLQPLNVDQAFSLTVSVSRSNLLIAHFKIAPNYYLYRDRFRFESPGDVTLKATFPQGELKATDLQNTKLKLEEIYSGHLLVSLKVASTLKEIPLTISYQGCSAKGFCYPVIQKTFTANLVNKKVTPIESVVATENASSVASLLTDQNGVKSVLNHSHFAFMLFVFAGLGLLLAFTPCVLPMIPILTSIIVGQEQTVSLKKAFSLSATYVLGTSLTYALAGVGAVYLGSSLQIWLEKPAIITTVSLLFVLLSLSLFGLFHLRMPRRLHHRLHHMSNKQQGGTYVGVFSMGVISTLIVSPCVTAPLVGVLMYIAQTRNVWFGASALFAMGLGMGLPLILIGMSAGKWLPKRGAWMEAVKKGFGFLMLGMAIWMFSRIVSPKVVMVLWMALLVSIVFFFMLYLPRCIGWPKLNYTLGLMIALVGGIVVFSYGISSKQSLLLNHEQVASAGGFKVINTLEDFNKQIMIAQSLHKPVMLDFYADWCESCIAMDKKVFAAGSVQNALNQFVLLRADLTNNTNANQALLENFSVVAPPTVLFFNNQGQEVNSRRIVGEVNAKEFLIRLNTFMTASCDKKIAC